MPGANFVPLAGPVTNIVVGFGQLSEKRFTAWNTTAPHMSGSVNFEMLFGQVIEGFSTSFTVTVKEQLVIKPVMSVTFHCTVVTPTGKVEPLGRPCNSCNVQPGHT